MRKWSVLFGVVAAFLLASVGSGAEQPTREHNKELMHQHHRAAVDERISLNLAPQMKVHQLQNMRAHLQAVQQITAYLAKGEFQPAAAVARQQLGLNSRMEQMCRQIGNDRFTEMGLAFHRSGDQLADRLSEEKLEASLAALDKTLQHCVACHATFRQ